MNDPLQMNDQIQAVLYVLGERNAIAEFVDYAFEHSMVMADVLNMIRDGGYINFMAQNKGGEVSNGRT